MGVERAMDLCSKGTARWGKSECGRSDDLIEAITRCTSRRSWDEVG